MHGGLGGDFGEFYWNKPAHSPPCAHQKQRRGAIQGPRWTAMIITHRHDRASGQGQVGRGP